jgi:hypothetical protein
MRNIFEPVVSTIEDLICNQIKEVQLKGLETHVSLLELLLELALLQTDFLRSLCRVSLLFCLLTISEQMAVLVGGLAGSPYLNQRIQTTLNAIADQSRCSKLELFKPEAT